jgi:hypothetical protein
MIASGSAVHTKGLGVIIGFCEEAVDDRLQIADRTKGAALGAPSAQLGKKAFDRVEPGARGGVK